jgi:hypothetical protein
MLENLVPNPLSRDHLQEKMKTTMSSTFLCAKGSYACRDHYIVPVDSPFGAYLLDHCCFVPYIDDSDFDENDDDDIDYSQVTHGGMPCTYSLMETMDLFEWNSPPPETMTASEHSPLYEKQA